MAAAAHGARARNRPRIIYIAQLGPSRTKRRDQEEGGELDSQEEASPEGIKSREVVLGYRERVGLLLLQLFPNGGATDIVFVTLFCIAVGTAIAWCCGRCAMPDGHCLNILLFLVAVHGSLGLPGWRLFRGFTLLSPFPIGPVPNRHSCPRGR